MHLAGTLVWLAMKTGEEHDLSELVNSKGLNAWTRVKIHECHHEVRQEDDQRKSVVQQILQKSTDFLRRIIAPVGGQGGSHCRTYALTAIVSRLKVTSGGVRRGTGRNSVTGGARRGGGQYDWRKPKIPPEYTCTCTTHTPSPFWFKCFN